MTGQDSISKAKVSRCTNIASCKKEKEKILGFRNKIFHCAIFYVTNKEEKKWKNCRLTTKNPDPV